ncbi:MAG TPA: iron ABC transporter permease [Dehalococcoidia bacterium]|nr:iron ABC transporter permease [Dehalococcoidia bacterium]
MTLAAPLQRIRSEGMSSLALWVPALVVVGAMLLPAIYLIVRASEGGSDVWDIVTRASTRDLLARTAWLALTVTAATIAIAVPAAWLTIRTDLPWRQFWSVALALPLVIPSYVGGFVIVAALGPRGILQDWLEPLGVERLPEIYGFWGAWLALTLFTYPYVLLNVQAALRNLDPAIEDASRGLGHGPLSTFFRITLPQLRPATVAGGLLVALYTLSDFGAVSLLRFDSFTRVIYIQYRSSFDRTTAAVLGLMLVALTIAVLSAEAITRGRARYHNARATRAAAAPIRLGPWRWPAFAACAFLALVALGMPLAVILYWLIDGLQAGQSISLVWDAAWNAFRASGMAALVAVAASLPIALLAVRRAGPATALLERASYLGHALPGIVVALSLVFFSIRYATPFYQTLVLLVFAYVVLFLPQALGSVRASLLQIPSSLEEAGRSLGRGPLRVLTTITLPLIRPGMWAGAALVFLTAMKELPATLLLSPTGYRTLATVIWSNTNEGLFTQASAAALLLIVIAAAPMALMVILQGRTAR